MAGVAAILAAVGVVVFLFVNGTLSFPSGGSNEQIDENSPKRELFTVAVNNSDFTAVQYGDTRYAVFDEDGMPVAERAAAEAALLTGAWSQAVGDIDYTNLNRAASQINSVDSLLSSARSASNTVVNVFDQLDGIGANIPFVGRVSALSAVRDVYPQVNTVVNLANAISDNLNRWGDNADALSNNIGSINALRSAREIVPAEIEQSLTDSAAAVSDSAMTIENIADEVSQFASQVSRFAGALNSASSTPVIGGAISGLASSVRNVGSQIDNANDNLTQVSDNMEAVSVNLTTIVSQASDAADDYVNGWLQNPPDTVWVSAGMSGTPQVTDSSGGTLIGPALPPRVTDGGGDSQNSRIAFQSDYTGDDYEIHTILPDGSDLKQLTNNRSDDFQPSWSPDGTRIAFVVADSGDINGNSAEIYTMASDGSDVRQLTNNQSADWFPSWSPDGSRLAFTSGNFNENSSKFSAEIYTMASDGSDVRRLTNNQFTDLQPLWSPDGSRIAFNSRNRNDENSLEIYTMASDGSDVRRLTNNHSDDFVSSWSPNGTRIAFVSTDSGHIIDGEIYTMASDGSDVRRLTNNQFVVDWVTSWSPDGTRIAFVASDSGDFHSAEIYTMASDGSDVRQLTNNQSFDGLPSWSPFLP